MRRGDAPVARLYEGRGNIPEGRENIPVRKEKYSGAERMEEKYQSDWRGSRVQTLPVCHSVRETTP